MKKSIFQKRYNQRRAKLIEYMLSMRKNPTKTEQRVRDILKDRRVIKFQVVIGPFIVDFLHRRKKLIIELDGSSHEGKEEYDRQRQEWLEKHGFRFLRFTNREIWLMSPNQIIKAIDSVPRLAKGQRSVKSANAEIQEIDERRTRKDLANSKVRVRRETIVTPYGKRIPPRCPKCKTLVRVGWDRCAGCQARIEFT